MSELRKIVHEPIATDQVPRDEKGASLLNLYVYLPTPRKYILFVGIGEQITPSRVKALEKHVAPVLFVRTLELDAVLDGKPLPKTTGIKPNEFEVLGQATNKVLEGIYDSLFQCAEEPPAEAIKKLETVANEIVDVIAPDVKGIKTRLMENLQYVWIMNDAAALTSLAILFATANGIDSRKSLREIVDACLVMDLSLCRLGKDIIDKMILDPASVTEEERKEYETHPLTSYQLAKKTLKHYSESSFELILNHHELNNSKGFPRQLRTATLFPLGKTLAAAVEAFERLKKASLGPPPGTTPSKDILLSVIQDMREANIEPHLRRHNQDILDKVDIFLKGKGPKSA